MIKIALPKGRLISSVVDAFNKVDIGIKLPSSSRKLFFYDKTRQLQFLIVRSQDVPVYIEYKAADLGIAGLDVLLEKKSDVFELIDLKIGYCKMVVAAKDLYCLEKRSKSLKVATKFPNVATNYFLNKGINVDIIKLYGSVELAPLLGISDCIVDIVETGKTLKENGLGIVDEIFQSSAFLVANKTTYYTKYDDISIVLNKFYESFS